MTPDHDRDDDDIVVRLTQMNRESRPPDALERDTIARLRASGLVRSPRSRWTLAAAAAAAVLVFVAGWLIGTRQDASVGSTPRYMLLLYSGDGQSGAPDTGVAEYRDWARGLRAAGHAVTGERLDDVGAVVLGAEAQTLPASRLRGYFVFQAPDADAALAIARAHPHLRHGGVVVMQRIRPT